MIGLMPTLKLPR